MAFKGLRFAIGEIRNNSAGAVMKLVMVAISVIPLLYGALYLLAFLDPYEQLNTVPVAVVNEDKGAVVSGEFRSVGDEVVDKLRNNNEGLGWEFVDAKTAREGLEAGNYYMTCTIPEGFTEDIASVETDSPTHAQLLVEYNETKNMLASQIGQTVWKEVRTEVSDAVAERYWNTVFDKVNDGADGLQEAADGAQELKDGLRDARKGSGTITDNLKTLATGSATLNEGLGRLSDGTQQLKDGTGSLMDGARTLKDGTGRLADGAKTLASGSSTLSDGASTLSGGASQVAGGAKDLKSGTASLASGASDLASGAADALGGAKKLQNEGTSVLAKGTSELEKQTRALPDEAAVKQAKQASKQLTDGIASLRDAGAKLATGAQGLQGGIAQLQQGVAALQQGTAQVEGALDTANSQLDTVKQDAIAAKTDIGKAAAALQGIDMSTLTPQQQQAIGSALQSLSSASNNIGDDQGGALLAAGTAQAYVSGAKDGLTGTGDPSKPGVDEGLAQLSGGLDQLATGADTLVAGIGAADDTSTSTLNGGLNNLAPGYDTFSSQLLPLVEKSPELRSAIKQLDGGAQKVDQGMTTLVNGAGQLSQGANQLSGGASQVDEGAGKLASGTADLSGGANKLADGAASVASGAGSLRDGASQVDGGVAQAVAGAEQLSNGVSQLHDGAKEAQSGSARIADGAGQLADGSAKLTSGLGDALDGSGELADGLADGVSSMRVANTAQKAQVMNDPVELSNEYYTTVKNYGTGFSPYFIALGLWVGALMTSFVFRPLNKRLILSGGNPIMVAFANYMPYALMSLVQALLVLAVLQFGLKLQIDNVGLYYAFGILTALSFAAILQMLTAAFGFPGKFMAIILLMLQLTSSAGTFPIEQTPAFFQAINPFLPMTYVVSGMRQVMTGLDMATVAHCAGVLTAIGIGCFLITALVARMKRMVTMDDLHPILQLG